MNLIDTLKNELSSETINSLGQKLNITPEQTQSGMSAIIPSVLAGILKKGSGAGSLGGLGSIFTGNHKSVDAEPESELEDDSSLLSRGSTLVSDLFGNKTNEVSDAIAQKTNLPSDKSLNLLTMGTPVVVRSIYKLIAEKGWSMPDFLGKLFEEKTTIENNLPLGLASTFGLAGLSLPHINQPQVPNTNVPPVVDEPISTPPVPESNVPPIERVVPHNTVAPEPTSSSGNILKWIIIIAILALLAWWFLGRNPKNMNKIENMVDTVASSATVDSAKSIAERTGSAIKGSLNEAGDWVSNLGANKTISLSDGNSLKVGEHSAESKLVDFIQDDNKMVDKDTWFSLDRLYFETGSATLKSESQEQLNNIAAIMKSYPNVKLKIGGYTDNTGSAEANKRVSTERANAAKQELVNLGISANRLDAEGYGQEHPVADNSTDEGRAQNRRIDVRVTEK